VGSYDKFTDNIYVSLYVQLRLEMENFSLFEVNFSKILLFRLEMENLLNVGFGFRA
jgi:hypothetical protein